MKCRIGTFLVLALFLPQTLSAQSSGKQEYSLHDILTTVVENAYRTEGLINDSEVLIRLIRDTLMGNWGARPDNLEAIYREIDNAPKDEKEDMFRKAVPVQKAFSEKLAASQPQSIMSKIAESDLGYLSYMAGDEGGLEHCYNAYWKAMENNFGFELSMYYSIDERRYAMSPFVLLGDASMHSGEYGNAEIFYKQAFPIDVHSPQYLYSSTPESIFDDIWDSHSNFIYKQFYSYPLHMLKLARAAKANGDEMWQSYQNEAFYAAVERLYRAFYEIDENRQMWLSNLYSPIFETQYGNGDTRWAYDAALFIKGCSNNVSADIKEMYTGYVNIDDWRFAHSQFNRTPEWERKERERIRRMFPEERYQSYMKARSDYGKDPSEKNAATLDSLTRRISNDLSWYKNLFRSLKFTYADVRDVLPDGAAAIEFVRIPGKDDKEARYDALILKKGYERPERVTLCSEARLRDILSSNRYGCYRKNDHALYDLIWKPMESRLQSGDVVLYAPDGLLNMININMLCGTDGLRLCERFNTLRASSTREACKSRDYMPLDVTLYGGLKYDMDVREMVASNKNYGGYTEASRGFLGKDRNGISELKYSLDEVNEIGAILHKDDIGYSLYTGTEGTEESFKSLSGHSPSILHLATHGFFMDEDNARGEDYYSRLYLADKTLLGSAMMRSGLLLSGAQNAWMGAAIPKNVEDGVLLAQEIVGVDLGRTSLLVLSACDTAQGDITAQGIVGLQQGFKKAGVLTMVLTLWEVNDRATKEFMTIFYQNILDGDNVPVAFREAQLAMSRDSRFSDPYYWAGFILVY
jgi:CHAT domain-containing protein